jgi:hypothetical protein
MYVRVDGSSDAGVIEIVMRCPHCRREVTLDHIGPSDQHIIAEGLSLYRLGWRRCPSPLCHSMVVIVAEWSSGQLLATYPPEVINFDATDLPAIVLDAFEEAIKCHAAGCYRAAAMMVRRTLEVLCDERGANGNTLEQRIEHLRDKVSLPIALFNTLHDLRYLGNDVGHDEATAAIMLIREVLKSLYQMDALAKALQAFKKAAPA